jgi:predicted transcriptional regulator
MKKQKQKDSDLRRWCDMLSTSSVLPDEIPEGWFTVATLADQIGKSICTTSQRVRKMVVRGIVERKDFKIQLEQRVRPVPHYRLK